MESDELIEKQQKFRRAMVEVRKLLLPTSIISQKKIRKEKLRILCRLPNHISTPPKNKWQWLDEHFNKFTLDPEYYATLIQWLHSDTLLNNLTALGVLIEDLVDEPNISIENLIFLRMSTLRKVVTLGELRLLKECGFKGRDLLVKDFPLERLKYIIENAREIAKWVGKDAFRVANVLNYDLALLKEVLLSPNADMEELQIKILLQRNGNEELQPAQQHSAPQVKEDETHILQLDLTEGPLEEGASAQLLDSVQLLVQQPAPQLVQPVAQHPEPSAPPLAVEISLTDSEASQNEDSLPTEDNDNLRKNKIWTELGKRPNIMRGLEILEKIFKKNIIQDFVDFIDSLIKSFFIPVEPASVPGENPSTVPNSIPVKPDSVQEKQSSTGKPNKKVRFNDDIRQY